MPFYNDAEQIYTVMQALFEHLRDTNPNPVDALISTRLSIRFSLSDPAAQITIHAKKRPVEITYGQANGRVDLDIQMTANQLHLILLDEYSIKKGFSSGELKVRGPVWKTLSLADVFRQGRGFYPQVLQEQGLG